MIASLLDIFLLITLGRENGLAPSLALSWDEEHFWTPCLFSTFLLGDNLQPHVFFRRSNKQILNIYKKFISVALVLKEFKLTWTALFVQCLTMP